MGLLHGRTIPPLFGLGKGLPPTAVGTWSGGRCSSIDLAPVVAPFI
jgi:hypothetical protein